VPEATPAAGQNGADPAYSSANVLPASASEKYATVTVSPTRAARHRLALCIPLDIGSRPGAEQDPTRTRGEATRTGVPAASLVVSPMRPPYPTGWFFLRPWIWMTGAAGSFSTCCR
jgi:hypothetical protein